MSCTGVFRFFFDFLTGRFNSHKWYWSYGGSPLRRRQGTPVMLQSLVYATVVVWPIYNSACLSNGTYE